MRAIILIQSLYPNVIEDSKNLADTSEILETILVPEVGLEPTKAYAERFTVSCHCH